MGRSHIVGGLAALAGAATNLLGLVVFVTLLLPKGLGDPDADPANVVALLVDNESAMRAWYLIIYLGFGVCLIFLSLELQARLSVAGRDHLRPDLRRCGDRHRHLVDHGSGHHRHGAR